VVAVEEMAASSSAGRRLGQVAVVDTETPCYPSLPTVEAMKASSSVGRRRGQAAVVDTTTSFRRGLPTVEAMVVAVVGAAVGV
jgi:hypothetical protein